MSDADLKLFEAWLEQNNSYTNTTPTNIGAGRGLGGTAQAGGVLRGEMLLAFPAAMLMDQLAAHRDPAIGTIIQAYSMGLNVEDGARDGAKNKRRNACDDNSQTNAGVQQPTMKESWAIILLLVHEFLKGKESFWFPYINLLPKSFDNALHFTAQQLDLLSGTHLADQLLPHVSSDLAQLGQVLDTIRTAHPTAFPQRVCTAETLRWAHSVFWSRALVVPLDSAGRPRANSQALCPYLDLLNHCPRSRHFLSTRENPAREAASRAASSSCSIAAPAAAGISASSLLSVPRLSVSSSAVLPAQSHAAMVVLVAGADVAGGSEVLINYGRKSNEQLLLYYGFSMRDNVADSVVLTFPQAQVRLWKGALTAAPFDAAREACRQSRAGGGMSRSGGGWGGARGRAR